MKKACDRAEVRGITSPYQKDPAAYLTLAAASLIKNDGMGSGKTLLTGSFVDEIFDPNPQNKKIIKIN